MGSVRPMGTPAYLGHVARLPVVRPPEDRRSPSPYGYGERSPTRLLTPQHLKRNGEYTPQTFEPRRFGRPQMWQSSTQSQWASVHGQRAFF